VIAVQDVIEFSRRNHDRYLSELKEYLAIASISTLPQHVPDMQQAARWLSNRMSSLGLRAVEVIPTDGHPIVCGEWLEAPGKPTILVYAHYDVQPVDPINEWISPPFEPTIRGDEIFARGASDMKGNGLAVLEALEAFLEYGALPVNVKVLFEGEEEIGSPNLESFLERYRRKLECDVVLNADSMILKPNLPSLDYGLRGLVYFEIWVQGPKTDLHSGLFGGSVHNPGQVLCELIAGMHDADGRVTLRGFYDNVRVLSDDERADLACIPHSDEEWREITGAPQLWGERGFSTIERLGVRPTLEVNGLLSGFTGEGAKTVLPAKAAAKISMRIVPNQDPESVQAQLNEYLRKNAPPTVTWEVKTLSSVPPAIVDRNTPAMRAASEALQATFGVKPIFRLQGGSVPVVSYTKRKLGVDTVLLGFGLPDDHIHGPNEKLHLPNYYRGIESYMRFFALVSGQESVSVERSV
jgi:acetylornithine deacetylase/succinyl-diaminopimelate desuccinylase-like protein